MEKKIVPERSEDVPALQRLPEEARPGSVSVRDASTTHCSQKRGREGVRQSLQEAKVSNNQVTRAVCLICNCW